MNKTEQTQVPDAYAANYNELGDDWMSTSVINAFAMCQIEGMYHYLEKYPASIGVRQTCGSGAHKGREHNLTQKIKSEEDVDVKEVTDAARDYVHKEFDTHEVQLETEFAGKSKEQAKGITVDLAVAVATLDREVFQPEIRPAAVEETMAVRYPGISRIIVGKLDVRETDGSIRDLKSGKRAFGQSKADSNPGVTSYGMMRLSTTGKVTPAYYIDNVVVTGKSPCKTNAYVTHRSEVQLQQQLERFAAWDKVISAGVFAPCDPSHWKCSRDYCAFHYMCPHRA